MKTIRPRKNWKFNPQNITVLDNFFTDECLKILRYRVLYGKYFDQKYDGYLAIDYFKNQDYLTDLIVKELNKKIKLPPFQRAWRFVYNYETKGVNIHCDPPLINLNVWVSSDKGIKDKSKNGLNIYKIKPPKNWTRNEWNSNFTKSLNYIKLKKIKPIKIEYKSNRAVFFDGAYFHNSNNVSMKKNFENKRVSYTMLFGSQLQ